MAVTPPSQIASSWTATHQYKIFRGGIGRRGLVCTGPVRGDVAYDVWAGDRGRRAARERRADTPLLTKIGKGESRGISGLYCRAKTILAVQTHSMEIFYYFIIKKGVESEEWNEKAYYCRKTQSKATGSGMK